MNAAEFGYREDAAGLGPPSEGEGEREGRRMMQVDLDGRRVVVTGGTGELGAAVVDLLLEAGAEVHLPVRDASRPGKLAHPGRQNLRITGGVDITEEKDVAAFYESLPRLWASVHAAGGFAAATLEETSGEDFHKMMAMNGLSCFLCCREAAKAIRRSGSRGPEGKGRIVNVAALPALEPRRGTKMIAYAASKAVVGALTAGLGEELAEEGIWVNAVAPSVMDTEANRKAMPAADFSKWAKVAEVAAAIVFLASPQNAAARGAIVPVYGRT